ncbi:hypothetical protein IE53DRAFT_372628 [Violaceomyces palustris]|uniref:Uncharacterized protein n=1 Tax=Violaceomyces palustris TaxID=1673888 RepID=A0ACD0P7Z0_9BASI|nr:hypothetical protein IE53DRAFT_372628 [Violaceomyces palustris]
MSISEQAQPGVVNDDDCLAQISSKVSNLNIEQGEQQALSLPASPDSKSSVKSIGSPADQAKPEAMKDSDINLPEPAKDEHHLESKSSIEGSQETLQDTSEDSNHSSVPKETQQDLLAGRGKEPSPNSSSPPSIDVSSISKQSQGDERATGVLADDASVAAVAQAFGRTASAKEVINQKDSDNLLQLEQFIPPDSQEGGASSPNFTNAEAPSQGLEGKDKAVASTGIKVGKGPPPTTKASEELPFDFNRFLEQMKHKSASPVGEYVRSFIKGFSKKPYRTSDQVKLIFDFLDFISQRMREAEVWSRLSDVEFDNATEAMEKLVMNRLYPYTFTPAVAREGRWAVQTDDLERDHILKQRIRLFTWLSEKHLDIPQGDHSRGFIEFSLQELLKINHYKAPRDKVICILNCCKVIFGLIRHLSSEENADTFIPILIFVVLKANPDNLISNVEYISRFRNPERLSSESGYYLSSLMGAIAFIETMDYASLSNISQEEFENRSNSVTAPVNSGEESANSILIPPLASSIADDTRAFFQRTSEAAKAGLGRPMGALGRLINESIEGIRTPASGESASSTPNRQESPTPAATPSRSRILSLFGSDPESQTTLDPKRPSSAGASAGVTSGFLGVDEEPQTPSTGDLVQDGFKPFAHVGANFPYAPARERPKMPRRELSVDEGYEAETGEGRKLVRMAPDPHDDSLDDVNDTPDARRRLPALERGFIPSFLNDTPTPLRLQEGNAGAGLVRGQNYLQVGPIALNDHGTPLRINQAAQSTDSRNEIHRDDMEQMSASMETLKSIFPTTEDDVIQMVLQASEGNVETAIDRLLEMS